MPNDFNWLLLQCGVGRKVAAMTLYGIYDKIYAIPIDRHTRRFLVCMGMVSSRLTDEKMSLLAEFWLERTLWIKVNYIAAGLAQVLANLTNDTETARIQKDLIAIADKYGFGEGMINFLFMNH